MGVEIVVSSRFEGFKREMKPNLPLAIKGSKVMLFANF